MEVLYTSERISDDPETRELLGFLESNEEGLNLKNAQVYYDFPRYSDYEGEIHKPDILIVSPTAGLIPIMFPKQADLLNASNETIEKAAESLEQFCTIMMGRLSNSRRLRKGLGRLIMEIYPVIYCPGYSNEPIEISAELITSQQNLFDFIQKHQIAEINSEIIDETRSVIEGAKALSRPNQRKIIDPTRQHYAAAITEIEKEISNFDQKQRQSALSTIPGPQRIRGLAGSGKTVILAMKAAHLHMSNPTSKILVTFYTKSLKDTIKKLITKFFRHYRDEDPNWDNIHVRHGWGSARRKGVYSDTCKRAMTFPLSFSDAKRNSQNPFEYVCAELQKKFKIKEYYDYILIDEGQDFPGSFYSLCYYLAKGNRDSKNIIWAYDDLQNILNIKMRTPEELFGTDDDGMPRISLQRSQINLPANVTNDIVLNKCYRNQGKVLVTSHALGFGIYGSIVQMLEDSSHWEDVGYKVLENRDLKIGDKVKIERPKEFSPLEINNKIEPVIKSSVQKNITDEINWVTKEISDFISGGMKPEDIVVIALDDRNAKAYFTILSKQLALEDIKTNNIIADPFNEPPFSVDGMVTLSTVYRAKGNEAAVIFAIGIDGLMASSRNSRNKIFTAFTRSKGWLRVSGIGANATKFIEEIKLADKNYPYLLFTMPDVSEIDTIQRDLSDKSIRLQQVTKALRQEGLSDEDIYAIIGTDKKNV